MDKEKKNLNYKFLAFGTVFLWASTFVFTKVALNHFTPTVVGFLRYFTASVVLAAVCGVKKVGFPDKKDMPLFIVSGACGFGFYMIFFNIGSQTLSSSTSSVIIATTPIITAVIASFIYKEKIKPLGWLAIAVEFVGILILMLWNGVLSINKGALWMLLAALFFSGYNLVQRIITKKYSAFQTTAYSIFTGLIILCVFLPQAIPQVLSASWKELAVVLYMGVLPSAVAYIWWAKALSMANKTSDVTNFMFVSPLLTSIMGFFIIMEIPPVSTVIGGIIIIIGLVLFSRSNEK